MEIHLQIDPTELTPELKAALRSLRMRTAWVQKEQTCVVCVVCGNTYATYFPTKALYCSAACRSRARKNIPTKCETCGKEFLRSAHSKARYCSRACSNGRIDR
jgi:hypothetical protein